MRNDGCHAQAIQPAQDIVNGCTYDNNLPCIAEKEIVAVASITDELMHYLVSENDCYLASKEEQDKLTAVVLIYNCRRISCASADSTFSRGKDCCYNARTACCCDKRDIFMFHHDVACLYLCD